MANTPARDQVHILGRNVAAYRKRAALKQEDLGEMIGVTGSTISVYEAGKNHYINMDLVKKIADVFDITVDDLFADSQVLADPDKWNRKGGHDSHLSHEPDLLKVEMTYEYTIAVGAKKYTVRSRRNITPGVAPTPFNLSCYGPEGLPMAEGQLSAMLKAKVFEVIKDIREKKATANGNGSR